MELKEITFAFVALLASTSAAFGSGVDLRTQSEISAEADSLKVGKLMGQAELSFDSGKYENAERSLRAALAINPNNSIILFDLSAVMLASNRMILSKSLLERAIKLSPEMAEAYFFLGTINERLWNYSKAQEYYRQFAQKFPSAYVDRRWSAGPEYCGRLVHYLRPRLSSREYTELKERCEHSCLAVSQPTNANVRFFGLVAQRSSESTDSGFPLPKLVMPFAQPIFSNKQLIIPELPDNISFLR